MIKTKQKPKGKLLLSWILIFTFLLTSIPLNSFAVTPPVNITKFDFIQTNVVGKASQSKIEISGDNLVEYDMNGKKIPLVTGITIAKTTSTGSTTKEDIERLGGKFEVLEGMIRITPPTNGLENLGMDLNGETKITIYTKVKPDIEFKVKINNLPSLTTTFVESKLSVGQKIDLSGNDFTDVTNVRIAEASHTLSKNEIVIDSSGKKIEIPYLNKGTLGLIQDPKYPDNPDAKIKTSIELIKESSATGIIGQDNKNIPVFFSVEYTDRVIVYDKLAGMDNLKVLPNKGPLNSSSLITVYTMDKDGITKLTDIFGAIPKVYLRSVQSGKNLEFELEDVQLKYENINGTDKVVGISGYTPAQNINKRQDISYDLVIKYPEYPYSEGLKKNAFTFELGNPSPIVEGLNPNQGSDLGSEDVTIIGQNIIKIATPGISLPVGVSLLPKDDLPQIIDNDTIEIDYEIIGSTPTSQVTYGGQKVIDVQRRIKTKIASFTNPKELEIKKTPVPYGEAHYTSDKEDNLVVKTTNPYTSGPVPVILYLETILKLENGIEEIIPEGTRYYSYTYIEKNPRPVITKIQPEHGFYHNVDGKLKPLMLRITGEKFQALRDPVTNEMKFPTVKFRRLGISSEDYLPVTISTKQGDTKILNNGVEINGIDKTVGDTLIISVIPNGDLKSAILSETTEKNGYKYIDSIIEIENPGGGRLLEPLEPKKFQFRYPTGGDSNAAVHSKQPIIQQVLLNGELPIGNPLIGETGKLTSEKDSSVDIKFKTTAGIDLDTTGKTLTVTLDGEPLKINSTKPDGDLGVVNVTIPKGKIGKNRLQLIIDEGLMDSHTIIFDNLLGPEIKELTPESGDAGTIVVIKRDTQANTIGFKPPIENSNNEKERIGTRVFLGVKDINETFNGYAKDGDDSVVFGKSEYFTNFKSPKDPLMLPGKYVYVVDSDTIYVKFPSETDSPPNGIDKGKYTIQVKNPDGSESTSAKIFTVIDSIAKTKIGTIDPGQDDETGGIIATITADAGTNFKGEIDIYFGSQKGTVVGYNLDYTKAYVKVPPLTDFKFPTNPADIDKIESFTVPVTVANKVNKSTDTKSDGFIYLNPNYTVKITKIYREGMSATDQNANKVNVGDYIWIEGENFRGTTTDGKTVENLPIVMFGYTKVQADDCDIMNMGADRAELSRIKVKVPPKPINAANDGSVDILVQNHDGAKAIKLKGVVYGSGNPSIDAKSTPGAKKNGERIEIFAKEIFKDGLIVAFGDRTYKKELGSTQKDFITNEKGEKEQIVVRYIPGQTENIEIYYRDPSGTLTLMKDATLLSNGSETATDGKVALGNDPGVTKIIGINWQNPDYHQATEAGTSTELKNYNKEYMSIKTIQEGSNNYLEIRRALGKVESFKIDKLNNSVIGINTPFHDKIEKTTITLINSDGSSATAPFEFHDGQDAPTITDLEGSKERTITIDGDQQKIKVKTQDYTVDGTMKILGKNFKDIKYVRIGTKDLKVESVSPDYTYMIVSVPKGTQEEVGQPLQITVVTKGGNAFSSETVPPVYFMYIAADSKPIIETITPVQGPRTGGTLVSITGKGFREKDEFGKVDRITVTVNGSAPAGLKSTVKNEQGEIVELKVIMPPSVTGKAKLQVINADGGTSEPKDFTYISQPEISQTEGSIFFNDTESEVKLFGVDFQSGAKVVIGAEQTLGKKPTDAKISGMVGVTPEGINQEGYLVGGVEATGVKVTGTNQITFKMPEGIESLDNVDIIIVNPDTGMSKPKPGNIKPPVPDVPDIEAIPGFERTMLLRWKVDKDVLNAAEKFEIYVRERRSGDYTFVGDTKQDTTEQSYVIKGLKYDTTYDILVRVLNKYGEAEDFASVRETTLKQNQDYKEKEKVEAVDKAVAQIETQGKQEVIGDTLYYTVGTRESTINLSNTTAKNKTKYVQIPVRDIKAGNKTITITDKDLSLTVSYSSLNTPELRNAPDDAVFRFKISAAEKQVEEGLTRAIPRAYKKASNVYGIYFELAQPKLVTPIAMLSGSATININAPAYPKYHAVYIESADTFSILQSNIITQGGNYVLLTNK